MCYFRAQGRLGRGVRGLSQGTSDMNKAPRVWIAVLFTALASAGDWPHWRGPFLNGSADERDLPAKWSRTENLAWVSPLPGPSGATPVIVNGRVFVSSTDAASTDLYAICLDERTGKELWRRRIGASARKVPRNNLASPSPVADTERVFFMYGSGELVGLNHDGELLWKRNVEAEYGNISVKYGYSCSPLLYDGKLFVLIQRRHTAYRAPESTTLDSFILAVDPATGENIWKQPRVTDALDESLDTYSSPIIFEKDGRAELIVIAADYATANDPETGAELWRYGYAAQKSQRWRNITSPVTSDELIYGVRPRGGTGVFALRSGGTGKLDAGYLAWRFDGATPDVCTPLYYKGYLYVLDGKSSKVLTCLDARTGRQKWQGRLGGEGPWRASVTGADDKLYCINEAGQAIVLAADPERFRVIWRVDMVDGPVQASIAIANGHLFIRGASKLYRIGR